MQISGRLGNFTDMADTGRPTLYKESYNEQVRKLCLLGATDKEIAEFFEIAESTLNLWKAEHPLFMESIREGKVQSDLKVASALYDSCMDRKVIEKEAIKVKVGKDQEEIQIVDVEKVIPADFRSQRFWLTNRKFDKWRDKHEIIGDPDNPIYHSIEVKIVKSGTELDK